MAHTLYCLLFLVLSPNHTNLEHEYFFSHTDIVETDESFQISSHIFIDDLESMFQEKGFNDLYIGTPKEKATVDSLLNAYLEQVIQLDINDQQGQWEWIGKEVSEDLMALWIYLEIPKSAPTESIGLNIQTLTKHIEAQKNIVNLDLLNQKRKYLLFDKDSKPKYID